MSVTEEKGAKRSRWLRWPARILAAILLLLFLLTGMTLIPGVQQWLADQASGYLSEKFQTRIELGSVRLAFPKYIRIQDLYVEDQVKDTLLFAGKIQLDVDLLALIGNRVNVNRVNLEQVKLNAHPLDSVMNYAFLLTQEPGKEQDPPSDSKADSEAKPWEISFDHSHILLRDIRGYFEPLSGAPVFDLDLGRLSLISRRIDLSTLDIELWSLALERTDFVFKMAPSEEKKVPKERKVANLNIKVPTVRMKEVSYRMETPYLGLFAALHESELDAGAFRLENGHIGMAARKFSLETAAFQFDRKGEARQSGFDYGHMDIRDIDLEVSDFNYQDLVMQAWIQKLRAREKSGLEVRQFASKAFFSPDSIAVTDFRVLTAGSEIRAPQAWITLPFLQDRSKLGRMGISLDLEEARVRPAEAFLFAPVLDSLFAPLANYPLNVNCNTTGELNNLQIQSFALNGKGIDLAWNGRIAGLLDYPELEGAITLERFFLEKSGPPLPLDSAILDWIPEEVQANGTIRQKSSDSQLNLAIRSTLQADAKPIFAALRAKGKNLHYPEKDPLFDLNLDSVHLEERDFMWLAERIGLDSIWQFPREMNLKAQAYGNLDSLEGSLALKAWKMDSIPLVLETGFRALYPIDTLRAELALEVSKIFSSSTDLEAYLPKDLIPDVLEYPSLDAHGSLTAGPDQIQAEFINRFEEGTVELKGKLIDKSYQASIRLDSFQIAQLFRPEAYDSLVGLPLSAFNLQAALEGEGWDLDSAIHAEGELYFNPLDTALAWEGGLETFINLDEEDLTLVISSTEPGLDLALDLEAIVHPDTTGQMELRLELKEFDLQKLALTQFPANLSFGLEAEAAVYEEERVELAVHIGQFEAAYDSLLEWMDTLYAIGKFKPEGDSFLIQSDLANMRLDGRITWRTIMTDLRRFAASFYDRSQLLDTLLLAPDDRFNLEVNLIQPYILGSGIVPGLTDLSPFTLNVNYVPKERDVTFVLEVPKLEYRGFQLKGFETRFYSDQDTLHYHLHYQDLLYRDLASGERLDLDGKLIDRGAMVLLDQRDSIGRGRFKFGFKFNQQEDRLRIQLLDSLLFNYQTWLCRGDPVFEIGRDQLALKDLVFHHQGEEIRLSGLKENALEIIFTQFQLNFFSRLLENRTEIFEGELDGRIGIFDLFEEPQFEIGLRVEEFRVLGARLGLLDVKASPVERGVLSASLDLVGYGHDFRVDGLLRPKDSLDQVTGRLEVNTLNLEELVPLTYGGITEGRGRMAGSFDISGRFGNPELDGELKFLDTYLRPAATNVLVQVDDRPIRLEKSRIFLEKWVLRDSLGGELDCALDLDLHPQNPSISGSLRSQGFLALNTTQKHNSLFFGRLFLSVAGTIEGDNEGISVRSEVGTLPNSSITYVNAKSPVGDLDTGEGVVVFVQEERKRRRPMSIRRASSEAANEILDLSLNLAINEGFAAEIILDTLSGDKFSGRAKGNLAFKVQEEKGKSLSGFLEMESGSYDMTYSEVIQRTFELERGSKITWTGNIIEPQLDLTASYTTRAAPYPLVARREASGSELDQYFRKETFVAKVIVKGSMEKSEVTSRVEYPRIPANSQDPKIIRAVEDLQREEAEMSQQAYSLILFNAFTNTSGIGEGVSMVSVQQGLNQLLTRQLNLLAGQYINFVELDFGLETNTAGNAGDVLSFEDTDFRVTLRKRFLEGRLVVSVDGVTGKRNVSSGNENQAQTYLDNIKVEYALNKKGTLKIKMYNQQDRSDVLARDAVVLGGGLVFSKSFKQLILVELKKRPEKEKLQ